GFAQRDAPRRNAPACLVNEEQGCGKASRAGFAQRDAPRRYSPASWYERAERFGPGEVGLDQVGHTHWPVPWEGPAHAPSLNSTSTPANHARTPTGSPIWSNSGGPLQMRLKTEPRNSPAVTRNSASALGYCPNTRQPGGRSSSSWYVLSSGTSTTSAGQ